MSSRIFESYSFYPNELRQISRQIAMVQVEENLRVKEIETVTRDENLVSLHVSYSSNKKPAPERVIYETIKDMLESPSNLR